MKKIIILSLILIIGSFSYSDVIWNGENQKITIIYKIVDPIIVEVEKPQKITVNSNQTTFRYSDIVKDKKGITVKVNTPYNQNMIDDVLRAIYEKVYFELQDQGKFELLNTTDKVSIINGEGFFVDPNENITDAVKVTSYSKNFANSVGGVDFYTTTQIDADFTMPQENMPMGVYTGILKLNVWFGGRLN